MYYNLNNKKHETKKGEKLRRNAHNRASGYKNLSIYQRIGDKQCKN